MNREERLISGLKLMGLGTYRGVGDRADSEFLVGSLQMGL